MISLIFLSWMMSATDEPPNFATLTAIISSLMVQNNMSEEAVLRAKGMKFTQNRYFRDNPKIK
jgi:hypothetical protein